MRRDEPVSDYMTIQTFSNRTGLPSSTLRYYEKEGLIKPDIRGENGYRLYREEQIPGDLFLKKLQGGLFTRYVQGCIF
jgi:DNA-binding transcriptional MerR regulator